LRLPGISEIKRNDVVVFNYPEDDIDPNNPDLGPVETPSMKENFIKRCIAVPGDSLQIIDHQVYINGKQGFNPPEMQYRYNVLTNGEPFNEKNLRQFGFRKPGDMNQNWYQATDSLFKFDMTNSLVQQFQQSNNVKKIEPEILPQNATANQYYPHNSTNHPWNHDQFGPIYIPKKGETVKLDSSNIYIYKRIIETYEKHKLEIKSGGIFIDGKIATQYTFEMNYYWMMGDNRNNSKDSRFWGYVPENHVLGKPLLVFFSIENLFKEPGFRWSRFCKLIE